MKAQNTLETPINDRKKLPERQEKNDDDTPHLTSEIWVHAADLIKHDKL